MSKKPTNFGSWAFALLEFSTSGATYVPTLSELSNVPTRSLVVSNSLSPFSRFLVAFLLSWGSIPARIRSMVVATILLLLASRYCPMMTRGFIATEYFVKQSHRGFPFCHGIEVSSAT
jgi:predicted AlkP superfamily pyrophosphatase or phosphodiesterase